MLGLIPTNISRYLIETMNDSKSTNINNNVCKLPFFFKQDNIDISFLIRGITTTSDSYMYESKNSISNLVHKSFGGVAGKRIFISIFDGRFDYEVVDSFRIQPPRQVFSSNCMIFMESHNFQAVASKIFGLMIAIISYSQQIHYTNMYNKKIIKKHSIRFPSFYYEG